MLWHPVLSNKRNAKVPLIVRTKDFMLSYRLFSNICPFFCDIEPANSVRPAVPTVSPSASQGHDMFNLWLKTVISFLCRSLRKIHVHPVHCPFLGLLGVWWTKLRLSLSPLGRLMKLHLLLQKVLSFRLLLVWQLINLNLSPLDQQMPSLDQGLCISVCV